MALIRIIESSELQPELSLRASDYINTFGNEDQMNTLVQQRMETGKALDKGVVDELTKPEVPAVAADQLWETLTKWKEMRQVRVISVGDTHAIVENTKTGNRTSVRLAAFRGRTKKDYYPVANGS